MEGEKGGAGEEEGALALPELAGLDLSQAFDEFVKNQVLKDLLQPFMEAPIEKGGLGEVMVGIREKFVVILSEKISVEEKLEKLRNAMEREFVEFKEGDVLRLASRLVAFLLGLSACLEFAGSLFEGIGLFYVIPSAISLAIYFSNDVFRIRRVRSKVRNRIEQLSIPETSDGLLFTDEATLMSQDPDMLIQFIKKEAPEIISSCKQKIEEKTVLQFREHQRDIEQRLRELEAVGDGDENREKLKLKFENLLAMAKERVEKWDNYLGKLDKYQQALGAYADELEVLKANQALMESYGRLKDAGQQLMGVVPDELVVRGVEVDELQKTIKEKMEGIREMLLLEEQLTLDE